MPPLIQSLGYFRIKGSEPFFGSTPLFRQTRALILLTRPLPYLMDNAVAGMKTSPLSDPHKMPSIFLVNPFSPDPT